ncbi:MAG: cell wall hydrolase [Oscillospiraceae bacterium]|nr:cell wall hydrolase [Oscillospiraceae bacterium]
MKMNIRLALPVAICFVLVIGIMLPALTTEVGAGAPKAAALFRFESGYITMARITSPLSLAPKHDTDTETKIDTDTDIDIETDTDSNSDTDTIFSILVDGEDIALESAVLLADSRAYVPLHDFCEKMGPTIMIRDEDSMTVLLSGLEITAVSGNYYIMANERYLYAPTLCKMVDDVMFVPIRALAKAFSAEVMWDDVSRTVLVSLTNEPFEHGETFYDETDLYWMSRIISAEARGECMDGKIAVGNVVMNRLRSSIYPDTVKGVIFDKRCGVQFSPAYSGSIHHTPDSDCVIAAKLALDGADVVGDSMYFNATRVRGWAARSRTYVTTIGNHNFYA